MKRRRIVLSVEKECYEHRSMKFTSVYNYRKKSPIACILRKINSLYNCISL